MGGAYEDPRLGAAGTLANDYVPQAEGEGEADHEYYPHEQGVDVGTVFTKALECFDDRHVSIYRTNVIYAYSCCLNTELSTDI